ncbi:hypothetical protein AB1Y20_010544 [Prymnesium parvum]|uniref:Pseudouridine synthase RsuA/RluA-like domain-containing protein n=1 Tax=Prymnesium parvum TaxID=97485 RepID=A0AB34IRQ8_PRYPA
MLFDIAAGADAPGARARLAVRENGRVLLRLTCSIRGCSVTLPRHNEIGDTRHISTGPCWEPRSLVSTLQQLLFLQSARANELVGFGAVYLNGRRTLCANAIVPPSSQLRVHLDPKLVKMPSHISVIHEDEEYLVCDKPAGLPVHATIDNFHQNVVTHLSAQLRTSLLVTSRLDAPTSGLLLLAKTKAWQSEFNKQLRERTVTKDYKALVEPRTSDLRTYCNSCLAHPQLPRHLLHWMDATSREPKRMSGTPLPGWQQCESELLHVRTVLARGLQTKAHCAIRLYELTLRLHTGRTHQLRAQLAFQGYPILGDTLYGARKLDSLFEVGYEKSPPEAVLHASSQQAVGCHPHISPRSTLNVALPTTTPKVKWAIFAAASVTVANQLGCTHIG